MIQTTLDTPPKTGQMERATRDLPRLLCSLGKHLNSLVCGSGEFKDGLRSGKGQLRYPGGAVYDGEWENDVRHGTGKYDYADGTNYQGEWKEGVRHGKVWITCRKCCAICGMRVCVLDVCVRCVNKCVMREDRVQRQAWVLSLTSYICELNRGRALTATATSIPVSIPTSRFRLL